jgi:hypothetical protein
VWSVAIKGRKEESESNAWQPGVTGTTWVYTTIFTDPKFRVDVGLGHSHGFADDPTPLNEEL